MSDTNSNKEFLYDQNYHLEKLILTDRAGNREVASLTVCTTEPLVITQDAGCNLTNRILQLPRTADIEIWADQLTIYGPIFIPGKTIRVFARKLKVHPDSKRTPPSITVNGEAGKDGSPNKLPKAANGNTGHNGVNNCPDLFNPHNSVLPGRGHTGFHGKALGKDGDGRHGENAGNIYIHYMSSDEDNLQLTLNAVGGRGGYGQNGQDGGDGGTGGRGDNARNCPWDNVEGQDGGKGGNAGDGARGGNAGEGGSGGKIAVLYNDASKPPRLTSFYGIGPQGKPGRGGAGGRGGKGGKGGASKNYSLYGYGGYQKITVNGGKDGPNGSNGKAGSNGIVSATSPAPKKGTLTVKAEGMQLFPLESGASQTFYSMMLEHAENYYLAAGDAAESPHLAKAVELFKFLTKVHNAHGEQNIVAGIEQQIFHQAEAMLHHIKHGQNIFGHRADFVPAGSKDYWTARVNNALAGLDKIEPAYTRYMTLTTDEKEKKKGLKAAKDTSSFRVNALEGRIRQLYKELVLTVGQITELEENISTTQVAAQDKISDVADDIKNAVGLTASDFLRALFNMVFLSESTFANAAVLVSQAGGLAEHAFGDIVGDDGSHIKKSYLVGKIAFANHDFQDLKEGYAMVSDQIRLDDPKATMLIYKKKKLDAWLDKIGSHPTAKAARKAIADYVEAVQVRNQAILSYNTTVGRILRLQADIANEKIRQDEIDVENIQFEAGLPAQVNFMKSVYRQAKANFVESLYMSVRAAAFWSLDKDEDMKAVFGDIQPGPINTLTAHHLANNALDKISDAHEAFGSDPESFSSLTVTLNENTHPSTFAALKGGTQSYLLCHLPAVGPETPGTESVFHGLADVRVSTVRAWLPGASTGDGEVQVRIRQAGRETIVSPAGEPFTASHAGKSVVFRYKSNKIGQEDAVIIDGLITKNDSSFTPIGPFADWVIAIAPEDNKNLDLSELSEIKLEFKGTARAFENANNGHAGHLGNIIGLPVPSFGSNLKYTFLGSKPGSHHCFSPIFLDSSTNSKVMGTVNAGNSDSNGLWVGGGGINGQFEKELNPTQASKINRYRILHQDLFGKAGNGGQTSFGASDLNASTDPVQFMMVKLRPDDPAWTGDYDGTVFVDVFNSGEVPAGNAKNYAMIYIAPPNGSRMDATGNPAYSKAAFLQAVKLTAKNILDALTHYNAQYAGSNGLEKIEVLRICAFSGGIYRHPSATEVEVVQKIYEGLQAVLVFTGVKEVQFENGCGEFNAIKPSGNNNELLIELEPEPDPEDGGGDEDNDDNGGGDNGGGNEDNDDNGGGDDGGGDEDNDDNGGGDDGGGNEDNDDNGGDDDEDGGGDQEQPDIDINSPAGESFLLQVAELPFAEMIRLLDLADMKSLRNSSAAMKTKFDAAFEKYILIELALKADDSAAVDLPDEHKKAQYILNHWTQFHYKDNSSTLNYSAFEDMNNGEHIKRYSQLLCAELPDDVGDDAIANQEATIDHINEYVSFLLLKARLVDPVTGRAPVESNPDEVRREWIWEDKWKWLPATAPQ